MGENAPNAHGILEQRVLEVQQALDAVYNGSGPEHRKADQWLQSFQQTPEAWGVADALLRRHNAELQVTFFGATTIYAKIRYDFAELPPSSIPALRASLMDHLAQWSTAQDVRPAVLTRLCLALAALAVQTNWPNAVRELSTALLAAGEQGRQRERAARVLLELLKLLPEECANSHIVVSDAARAAFSEQLRASSRDLLGFLAQVAADPLGKEVMVQETIFKCLQSWLRHCSVPPEDLAALPLFPAAFEALRNQDLFETAVDLLVEVLRVYDSPRDCGPVVALMVPRAMALGPAFATAVAEEDEDTARGYCRLFTEMGESYIELVMDPQEQGQLHLVGLLLQCTAHPVHEIATIPLHFWYRLCSALVETAPPPPPTLTPTPGAASPRNRPPARPPPVLWSAQAAKFAPCLQQLVHVLVRLMRYPEDMEQLAADQHDELKRHRYDVGDVLNDCARVLGGEECVRLLLPELEREVVALAAAAPEAQAATGWQMAEACLFAIRGLARVVPPEDNQVVPVVMALLPRLPAHNAHLRYTANLVVGRYADWLRNHPEHLEPMFGFLLAGFGSPECAAAAATAIKSVCVSCGAQMGEPVLAIYDQLLAQRQQLPFADELEILEGLCHVAAALPPADASRAAGRMAAPVAEALARMANAAAGEPLPSVNSARAAGREVDRLTCLVRHVAPPLPSSPPPELPPHPLQGLVAELFPALEVLLRRHPEDSFVEKCCRCVKHVMRALGPRAFAPLLPPLMALLVERFAAQGASPYLYLASICVVDYGRTPGCSEPLFVMLEQLSAAAAESLGDFVRLTAHPDVAEEYFYLVERFLTHCPDRLMTSPLLDSVLVCGTIGLQLHHREAHRGILRCLETLVSMGLWRPSNGRRSTSNGSDNGSGMNGVVSDDNDGIGGDGGGGGHSGGNGIGSASGAVAPYRGRVETLLSGRGAALVRGLVGCCVGELPAYALDAQGGSVAGVLWELALLCPRWLQEWMAAALAEAGERIVPPPQRAALLEQLFEAAGRGRRSQFLEGIRNFSHASRQNARRWNATA